MKMAIDEQYADIPDVRNMLKIYKMEYERE